MALSTGEQEAQRITECINDDMDLSRIAATAAA
jgi:hypothetical protein